jgi:hypothetical protein
MSKTPTEIWCRSGLYYEYKQDWSEGSWQDNDNCGGEKYVRADRIEELEAKLARAMEAIEAAHDGLDNDVFLILGAALKELKGENQ